MRNSWRILIVVGLVFSFIIPAITAAAAEKGGKLVIGRPSDAISVALKNRATQTCLHVPGPIVSCLGTPVDGGGAIGDTTPWPLTRDAPNPLQRKPVDEQLVTGIRSLDGVLGIGLGQRLGLFAGPIGMTSLSRSSPWRCCHTRPPAGSRVDSMRSGRP